MRQLTFRLQSGQLLKEEIERVAQEKSVKAGVLLSVVGGLDNVVLRMPKLNSGDHAIKELDGPFELVSGTGTISKDGCHIHIAVSDKEGKCYGGHLKDGCRVRMTAEIVIGIFDDVTYTRVPDEKTGFDELRVGEV